MIPVTTASGTAAGGARSTTSTTVGTTKLHHPRGRHLAATRSWPSQQIGRRFDGLALHDMRTLVSDLLRGHDPSTAPRIVQALLGHLDPRSGEDYRHACEDDPAQEAWMAVRREVAKGRDG